MGRTAERVREEAEILLNQGFGTPTGATTEQLLLNRLNGQPLRAYYVALISRYLKATVPAWKRFGTRRRTLDRLFERQLPLIIETVICIQYLHNQLLDGKKGSQPSIPLADRLLVANTLKEQLYQYIQAELPRFSRHRVEATVRSIFEAVDWGQQLDRHACTYTHFDQQNGQNSEVLPERLRKKLDLQAAGPFIDKIRRDLPEIYHSALELYFERIYLVCAYLFVAVTRLIGQLLGAPAKFCEQMEQFACCYGIMRQLVNDNADYLPIQTGLYTQGRGPADAQSDWRRGLLTLPLFFFLAKVGPAPILLRNATQSEALDPVTQAEIFHELLRSSALHQSIQNARILNELALSYLDPNEEASLFLADTCAIAHWNKFIVPCHRHPSYADYRKTAYCRQTKQLIRQLREQRQQQRAAIPGFRKGIPAHSGRVVGALQQLLLGYQPVSRSF